MKRNNKYLVLLYLCVMYPVMLFFYYIFMILILSIYLYINTGDILFDEETIYTACEVALFGIPFGIVLWYVECRWFKIKIFGK